MTSRTVEQNIVLCSWSCDKQTHTHIRTQNCSVGFLLELCCCNSEMVGCMEKENQNQNLMHAEVGHDSVHRHFCCLFSTVQVRLSLRFALSSFHLTDACASVHMHPAHVRTKGKWWEDTSTIFNLTAVDWASEVWDSQICIWKNNRHWLYLHCTYSGPFVALSRLFLQPLWQYTVSLASEDSLVWLMNLRPVFKLVY